MKNLVLLLALLLTAAMAQAAPPERWTDEVADHFELVDCGDFQIWDDALIFLDGKDFFDRDGNYVRSQIKFLAFDDLYNKDDPDGTHLTGTAHLNVRLIFDKTGDPLWVQQGIAIAIVVPGYGPVFMDVGRLIWNDATGDLVFSAGRHHDWNFGDFEALCDYFDS